MYNSIISYSIPYCINLHIIVFFLSNVKLRRVGGNHLSYIQRGVLRMKWHDSSASIVRCENVTKFKHQIKALKNQNYVQKQMKFQKFLPSFVSESFASLSAIYKCKN
jgi:hypothetical protein